MCLGLHVKCPLFLSYTMKIPHFVAELLQTEGQTVIPNVIFAFHKLCERAKNEVANILMPRT